MVPYYKVKYIDIKNTYINIHKYKSYTKQQYDDEIEESSVYV